MEVLYNMRQIKVYQVDSFTKEKFRGNPAGVVLNADKLNDSEMQQIARELNNSETAFIINTSTDDYDCEVRFFTPMTEVPICGHATIAAHYVRSVFNCFESQVYNQKTKAGILPVEIVKSNNDYQIIMTQSKIEFGEILSTNQQKILLESLGLNENNLYINSPVQIVSTGHSKVLVRINSKEILDSIKPDNGLLCKLSSEINCNGFFVFSLLENTNDNIISAGRMFAPAIGITEDPVTGNANGPLGAYLVKYGLIPFSNGINKFRAIQGETIGRTGIIDVQVKVIDNSPVEIKVGGTAVIVFETEITL